MGGRGTGAAARAHRRARRPRPDRLVDLAPSGSERLAALIADAFADRELRVALLREHGTVAVGPDLRTAYYHADYLEDTAKVALLAAQVEAVDGYRGFRSVGEREAAGVAR